MYELVADIESYPSFLPWCSAASVQFRSDDELQASLQIAFGPLQHWFTTRNHLEPGSRIHVRLVEGPFRYLEGKWHFSASDGYGCVVSLDMEFDFSSRLRRLVAGPVFHEIAKTMVRAFCERAAEVHQKDA